MLKSLSLNKVLLSGALSLGLLAGCGNSGPAASTSGGEPLDMVSVKKILSTQGLTKAEEALRSQSGDAAGKFALGAVQTLRGVEHILQVRYAHFTDDLPFIPGGEVDIPKNPNGKFDPAFVETALTGALGHFANAQSNLAAASGQDFAVEIDLKDIWFDINKNGTFEPFESGLNIMVGALDVNLTVQDMVKPTVVRFDTADADWLNAYTHVVSGISELILSVDPTEAIDTVYQARIDMEKNGIIMPAPFIGDDEWVDSISAFLIMMRGQPDKTRTRAALAHFKSMTASNRKFWEQVAKETDNDREWLPNPAQQSVFGVEVNAETAETWQEVLNAMDDMLEGRTLIPYWRTEIRNDDGMITNDGVGINFAKMMNDPKDFDVILLVQGAAIAPYLEKGPLMDGGAWRRFERLTGRRSMLFAFWLN